MSNSSNKDELTYRSVWERIMDRMRRRSLWMLHYCTGCGAIELPPTMTSRFDMSRFGIAPMVTPRQADVLLITGYLSVKTLKRVILSYEQMQAPKWVIGFGSCTINGGMYWNSYATIKRLDYYLPVEIYIAGCMPRPEAIISAFNVFFKRIDEGKADSWKKYYTDYDFYRKNQEELFGPIETYTDIKSDAAHFGIV